MVGGTPLPEVQQHGEVEEEDRVPQLAALSVSEHLASVAHRLLRFTFDRFLFATRLLIKSQA